LPLPSPCPFTPQSPFPFLLPSPCLLPASFLLPVPPFPSFWLFSSLPLELSHSFLPFFMPLLFSDSLSSPSLFFLLRVPLFLPAPNLLLYSFPPSCLSTPTGFPFSAIILP
jgi:hypothetical protein